jgi:AcrR family transcriptional regulator
MSYLNREQRREMILTSAKQLALQEGLASMTVRGIASAAHTSTGQVHHHFASTAQLKAEVFIALMQELHQLEAQVATQNYYQRLSLLLGCENIAQVQPYLRLWNEAEILMHQDPHLQQAYAQTMQQWHLAVQHLIEQGSAEQVFHLNPVSSAADVAWRLIAFVCGLEGVFQLRLTGLDHADFQRYMTYMFSLELGPPQP